MHFSSLDFDMTFRLLVNILRHLLICAHTLQNCAKPLWLHQINIVLYFGAINFGMIFMVFMISMGEEREREREIKRETETEEKERERETSRQEKTTWIDSLQRSGEK